MRREVLERAVEVAVDRGRGVNRHARRADRPVKDAGGRRGAGDALRQPPGRLVVEPSTIDRLEGEGLVGEDPAGRGGAGGEPGDVRIELLEEGRGLDDRIVLEAERGHRHLARRELQQVEERRARRRDPVALGRPPEPGEERGRVEDVARGAAGPVGLDEADQVDAVEATVARRVRVEQVHPLLPPPRRERLPLHPAAHRRRDVRQPRPRVVEPGGLEQLLERAEDRRARPALAHRELVAADGRPPEPEQEREQAGDVRREAGGREQRRQRIGDDERRAPLVLVRPGLVGQGALEIGSPGRALRRRRPSRRGLDDDMRRREQGEERARREARGHRGENEIERGGERFGGQRQGVGGLVVDPRGLEDGAREVDVRQRPGVDDREAVERRSAGLPRGPLHLARDVAQFLFPVAAHPVHGPALVPRNEQGRRRRGVGHLDLLEFGEAVAQPLEKPGAQQRARRDQVHRGEPRQAGQQVEVGRVETPCRVGRPIRDRDDRVGERGPGRARLRPCRIRRARRVRRRGLEQPARRPCSSRRPVARVRSSYSRKAATRNRVCARRRSAPRSNSARGTRSSRRIRSNASTVRSCRMSVSYRSSISPTSPGRIRKGGELPAPIAARAAAPRSSSRSSGESGRAPSASRCRRANQSSRVSSSGSTSARAPPSSSARSSNVCRSTSAAARVGTRTTRWRTATGSPFDNSKTLRCRLRRPGAEWSRIRRGVISEVRAGGRQSRSAAAPVRASGWNRPPQQKHSMPP